MEKLRIERNKNGKRVLSHQWLDNTKYGSKNRESRSGDTFGPGYAIYSNIMNRHDGPGD